MREATARLAELAPQSRPWFQLDRGADINHVLEGAMQLDADFTVRSTHDRKLDTGGRLRSALLRRRPLGQVQTTIQESHAAAGQPRLRHVELTLRAKRVALRLQTCRGHRYGSIELTVVHVRETGAARRTRIEWYLLTNVAVHSVADAFDVVRTYRGRWHVEEFYRAWKSGLCNVEASQLRSGSAFRKWATILAAVASRAERLKSIARADPNRPASDELTRHEIDAAILLSQSQQFDLGDDMNLAQAIGLIARIGGYTGPRNSGGPPGTTVISRGLHDVTVAAHALALHARRSG
jgi:hypothetical protein